jgi:TetR/AcrR family transcriptional repressor of nem operon
MLFWEKGYANTSLKDLLSEMEILNGSFYNSFGNKKNLFIKALEKYQDDFKEKRSELFNSGRPFRENIRTLFNESLDRQKSNECPRGCFLVNSISSETLADKDIIKLVQEELDEFQNFIAKQIEQAQEKGELSSDLIPHDIAAIVLTYLQGIMKVSMLEYSDEKFKRHTESLLSSLGL